MKYWPETIAVAQRILTELQNYGAGVAVWSFGLYFLFQRTFSASANFPWSYSAY